MSEVITLERFAAMPGWERDFYRRYGGQEFPPDEDLPPPAEVIETRGGRYSRMVYFIQAGDAAVKIGITVDSERRLRMLQTANHEELTLLCETQGGKRLEEHYHFKFRKHHIRGEWFRLHRDILKEVGRIKMDDRANIASDTCKTRGNPTHPGVE